MMIQVREKHVLVGILVMLGALGHGGLTAQQSDATSLAGVWEGELVAPPAPLDVSVRITATDNEMSATFSLPAEGIQDMPMTSVSFKGDSLILHLTPSRVVRARVQEDVAHGTLVMHDQGDRTMDIRLFRQGSPAWSSFIAEREASRDARESALAAHTPPPLEQAAVGPAAGRVDPVALARLVEEATASHSAALVVILDGELVGEWYSGGASRRIEAMSATKSILSLAVGRLLQLGLLDSVDVPVHQFYQSWDTGDYREVTVRHLLSHTSGLESPMPTTPIYANGDFVRFALESELTAAPGAELTYNNNATNLLAGIIGKAAGQRMDRFIAEELFSPLGIKDLAWSLDNAGTPHGMAGLQIHARDLARLGELVLAGGEWNGERLIAEEWLARSLSPASDHSESVGFLWWLEPDDDGRLRVAEARGYLGQYLTLLPEQGLVGVRMIESFRGYHPDRDGFQSFSELLGRLPSTDSE